MSTFVISWCQEGLEGIIPVSDLEKKEMWDVLNGKTPAVRDAQHLVNMMLLRARFNPQRHYEVYAVDTEPSIGEEDLRRLFIETPQYAADLVRARGKSLFSDRAPKDHIKIT